MSVDLIKAVEMINEIEERVAEVERQLLEYRDARKRATASFVESEALMRRVLAARDAELPFNLGEGIDAPLPDVAFVKRSDLVVSNAKLAEYEKRIVELMRENAELSRKFETECEMRTAAALSLNNLVEIVARDGEANLPVSGPCIEIRDAFVTLKREMDEGVGAFGVLTVAEVADLVLKSRRERDKARDLVETLERELASLRNREQISGCCRAAIEWNETTVPGFRQSVCTKCLRIASVRERTIAIDEVTAASGDSETRS